MSFIDEYNALKKKRKKEETGSSQNAFMQEYNELKAQRTGQGTGFGKNMLSSSGVTPTVGQSQEKNDQENRAWFQSGPFADGFDILDIPKVILGTTNDISENVTSAVFDATENLIDTGAHVAGTVGGWFSDDFREGTRKFIAKDLLKSEETGETINKYINPTGILANLTGVDTEQSSVLGDKADGLVQSGAHLVGSAALQMVGVPMSVTMGVNSFGSEIESAFQQDATWQEGTTSAGITTAVELLTEKIFGGIKFGGNTLDDVTIKPLIDKISNKVVRALAKFGVDTVGEGFEEYLSGWGSAIGQKLTYADDKELSELYSKEDKLDAWLSGMALSFGNSSINAVNAYKHGVDYVSGMTANEEAVVNKVTEDRIAELEKDGKKLKVSEKNKIKEQVKSDLAKGYISTDTIEEVLGGETYKTYKDTVDSEDALQKEFEDLGKKQNATLAEQARYSELSQQIKELQDSNYHRRNYFKSKLSQEVSGLVANDRLSESYNEKARRSQAYQADLTKYGAKQQAVIQKAIDSGILNNTRRTHEFVDMVAKISADKGVLFDFADNAKLKESGFALDGKVINGYVTKDGVTVNIDSAKSLNSVVGHEITHVLEGTDVYDALKQTLFDYAKSKGEYQGRYDSLSELYKNVKDADVEAELAADLVGDYLFTDADFINNLSTQNRNVFQKIYDEIKYLYKVATAGSKEARELEKVKKAFEKAYREGSKGTTDTKYSLSDNLSPLQAQVLNTMVANIKREAERNNISLRQFYDETAEINAFSPTKADVNKIADSLVPIVEQLDIENFYAYLDKMRSYAAETDTNTKYSMSDSDGKQLSKEQQEYFKDSNDHDIQYSLSETTLEQRLSGDALLDAQDLIAEIEDVAEINPNGYVTVYHRTTAENAKRILESGKMSAKEDGIFFSTQKDGAYSSDYGEGVVELKVPVEKLVLDDIFDTEAHLRIPLNSRKETLDVSAYLFTDGLDAQNEQGLDGKGEVSFSLSNDTAYMDNAIAKNNSMHHVDTQLMEDAKAVRSRIAERMNAIKDRGLVGLPEDIEGNTYIANSSYDGTEENTTICPRSLASEAFVDAVSEYLGRPLSVDEQIYISQDLQGRSLTPECTYCYVATDRKAYRAFLGEYIKQRDSVLDKLRNNPTADVSRSGEMYKEFLNGRKDTNPMYSRFKMWVNAYKNGTPMVDASHLANINKLMGDINSEFGEALKPQIVDAMKYAQSASWAKKRVNYVAYNGHILKWKQDRINKLNSHYGLRMYSFSDFHPAFVLENMQMITDASVRGLKMLGYTKDTDFVEIFAPSGMNINVSTFGFESDGNVYENNIIGAEWEKAKALREQYPNVGVTFVATNDTLVEWALEQDWIDVVIPYHLVRTGAEVAKAFNYTNYTSESSDTKTKDWKKGDRKYIAPTEHNNDLDTYLAALEKNHLNPRFKRFLDNPKTRPYYMKLVNECRQSASESKPVQPVFNEDAAMVALAKLEANGYYQPIGGSVDRMYEIAADVAENMTQQLAPTMSLSEIGAHHKRYGNYNVSGKDIRLDKGIAPVKEILTTKTETAAPVAEVTDMFPDTPVQDIEELMADAKDIMGAMEAYEAVGDTASVEQLMPEYEAVMEKIGQIEEEDRQRVDSLTEGDIPPEMDAPYYSEVQPTHVYDPFAERDESEVGKRSVNAYMYENPEVKPFFQEEALKLLGELNDTTRGERWYNDEVYYESGGEKGFGGVKRHTSASMEELLDSRGMSYADIEKGLNAIIEDHGAENIAAAKKLEFMLNDRLLHGYKDFYSKGRIPPNQDYINLLTEKQITEYSKEAFDAFMANADQYAPPVDDDIAPVQNAAPTETVNTDSMKGVNKGQLTLNTTEDKLRNRHSQPGVDAANLAPMETVNAERRNVQEGQQAMWEGAKGEPKQQTRKELHGSIIDNIKSRFSAKGFDLDNVLKGAKNLSTFATVDNTPQRVMEKALGYKEGQILSDITVNQVAQNETEGTKWLNSFTDRKSGLLAQLSKKYNIKPGSKQSAAAQMYAEGFYVNENNEIIKYGDAELAKDFPDFNVQANIKGLARDPRIRQIYDDTLAMINESRTRNAYPEIPRLDNYFLHFRAMDDTFSRLGLPFNPNDIRAKDLPTDLNGVTADLKPGQPYFASAMHRKGMRTSFDLLGGLERYLTSAKNQIYHIDDIQTLRALRNYIADTYGQANGLEGLDALSEEEAQERIEKVYSSHLSTFAKFLNEEANVLAGKTALIDRGLEGILGRRGMTFLDTVNKQVGSNMVGFNISSSLTNFLPVAQTFAKTNKADFVKAFGQTVGNKIGSVFGKTDGFTENSPVVIRRKGADRFYRTPFQKVGDAGYVFMSAVDDISTELIARTKYNELIRKGMDSQQAHYETDKWVSRLMGDRSLGQMPQLYNSKMLGLITKFQLEVRNQLDSQFYDTIQEAKVSNEHIQNGLARNAKTAAKVTSTFVQLAVAQHLFGKAFESVAGYNPAFDIIEVIMTAFGFDDEEESEDTVLDNIEQAFLAMLEDLPYTSTFTGGRIPISSALPIKELVTGKDDYGTDKSRLETLGEVAPYYVLPGGYGQIKKTVQGVKMFSDEHPVTGSYTDKGDLRFPVDDTLVNRVQAGVFGQYASKNARDYFDNERSPLSDDQIKEYIDLDAPIGEYWEYREGLKGLKTLAKKADYINSLDLQPWQKNLLINNIADRKEDIDMTSYDEYGSFEEFDFASKNPEKYEFLTSNGVTYDDYRNGTEEYKSAWTWAFKNPDKFTLSKVVSGDLVTYKRFTGELNDIKGDKDANGDTISGSRKENVIDYINNLDADYGEKIILFKSEYPADDTYNYEIIDYLNSREDISYSEMETILKELGFNVSSDGNITWD